MQDLKNRLLASIDYHKRIDIEGLYKAFAHEKKFSILRGLFILQNEGWVRIRKKRVLQGFTVKRPNVARTNKTTYTQTTLFKSCKRSCSPSDFVKGGKCDINGCYY